MKQMLFIMNPCAGTKKANRYLTDIIGIFNRADYQVRVYITAQQGDAAQVVAQQAHGMDAVVCCGGDGTFNETLSGLMQAGLNIPIGYIPAGSTNDFATSLELPSNILEAAQNIVEGEPVAYDAGMFNERCFSYVASFGAFTRASYATSQNVKNALGHTAYLLSGIQELSQIRDISARLELDDEVLEGHFIFGAICNSTSVGGILTLDPGQVDMRDGRFEILLVRAPKDLAEIAECIQAFQNKTYNCKMVSFRTATTVKVTMDTPQSWTLDGEQQDALTQVQISNRHLAYRLLKKAGEEA